MNVDATVEPSEIRITLSPALARLLLGLLRHHAGGEYSNLKEIIFPLQEVIRIRTVNGTD